MVARLIFLVFKHVISTFELITNYSEIIRYYYVVNIVNIVSGCTVLFHFIVGQIKECLCFMDVAYKIANYGVDWIIYKY